MQTASRPRQELDLLTVAMTAAPLLHSILSAATPPARRQGNNQRRELAYLSREAMKGCGARRGATCRAAHRQSNKARRLR